jgi:hypothetical protein
MTPDEYKALIKPIFDRHAVMHRDGGRYVPQHIWPSFRADCDAAGLLISVGLLLSAEPPPAAGSWSWRSLSE